MRVPHARQFSVARSRQPQDNGPLSINCFVRLARVGNDRCKPHARIPRERHISLLAAFFVELPVLAPVGRQQCRLATVALAHV